MKLNRDKLNLIISKLAIKISKEMHHVTIEIYEDMTILRAYKDECELKYVSYFSNRKYNIRGAFLRLHSFMKLLLKEAQCTPEK